MTLREVIREALAENESKALDDEGDRQAVEQSVFMAVSKYLWVTALKAAALEAERSHDEEDQDGRYERGC